MVLAHPDIGVLPEEFPHGALWQSIFWAVLILLVIIGWFTSVIKTKRRINSLLFKHCSTHLIFLSGVYFFYCIEHCSFIVKILKFKL